MMSQFNILIAFIPALCWGSIGLISGKLGGKPKHQTLGMAFGALIFTILSVIIQNNSIEYSYTPRLWLIGLFSGLFWTIGQVLQFSAMKNIGISKAIPISTGCQLLANSLLGALIFHEWESPDQLLLGFIALFILILGSTLTAIRDKSISKTNYKENWKKGTLSLIFSTIGYLGYTSIIIATKVDTKVIILPQGIGMFFGALIFSINHDLISKDATKSILKNIITGIVWGIGNFFMFLSTEKVGLAISFSLSQTGIIISTFGSIFILKENKTKKELLYVSMGCLLVIVGGILLGTMKK